MKIKNFPKKLGMILVVIILLIAPPAFVSSYSDQIYFEIEKIPSTNVAIVFGAGVKKNGQPSDVLKDRLITAAELYEAGKVEKILVSGDNRFENYSEPDAMYNYLIDVQKIPEENIIRDFAGRRTFDTCIRAKKVWGIEKAILVSQEYHLTRAIFTCEGVGIESVGFSATRQSYVLDKYFKSREFAAVYKAFWDVYIWEPEYIEGEREADL